MKQLISLMLCIVLLISLTGCRTAVPQQTAPAAQPTQPPTQPVEEVPLETEQAKKYENVQLQYWSLLTEEDPEAVVVQQAAAFFEKTTGARVEINWQDGDPDVLAKVLDGGAGADLFETSGSDLETRFGQYALTLTDLAKTAGYEEKSWDVLRTQILSRCGALKALALRPHLYGLYYNRDRFDKLGIEATPSGWEEYVAFCQTLKDRGYEALAIDEQMSHILLELHMERALGWEGLKETMINARWRSNEMAMTMIHAAIRFAEDGYVVKGTPASYPSGQDRLVQSNAVLAAGSEVLCMQVEASTMMEANWGVFPYPGDGPGKGLLVDADVLAISSNCTHPEAAFDFALLLATGEFDQLRADLVKGIPADPGNISPITGASVCMSEATAQAPKWFTEDQTQLFSRLWNGWYKTDIYFADQLNKLSRNFESEKSVG